MNDTQRRFIRLYLDRARKAYLSGDVRLGDQYMASALTWQAPIGAILSQTYN